VSEWTIDFMMAPLGRSSVRWKTSTFDYIEMFYNPKRRHGFNDRLSPAEFERRHFERLAGV